LSFKFGEIYSEREFSPYKIIGESESDYIVVCKPRNIKYYDSDVSGFLKNIIGYAEYSIALVDKNQLSISKKFQLPDFKAESITKKAYPFIHGIFLSGDTLQILTSVKDKVQKDYAVHVWHLNSTTLEPFTSEASLITRLPDLGKNIAEKILVKKFENSNEIAIIYTLRGKKESKSVVNILHLNSHFKNLKKDSIIYDDNQHWSDIKQVDADSSGNIFVLSGFSDASSSNMEDSRWIGLDKIPADGGRIISSAIKTKSGNAFSGNFLLNPDGIVVVCGYYSSYINQQDRDKEVFGGSYITRISAQSGEILSMDEAELTDNQKKALYPSNLNPNSISSIFGTISNLKIKNFNVDSQGDIIMTGIVASSSISRITRGNSQYSTKYYESNSVFISKFNLSGNVIWQTIVPRSSSISDFDGMLNPLIYFDEGNTTLFFNDHLKNVSVMNKLSVSEGNVSNPSLSEENDEPLDLPPSSSDEILTIKEWQQDNTVLRKTTIDSTGKWKVTWIRLKPLEEYDKNAILESSIMYTDLEGNLISVIYPKYGLLNKVQSAAFVKFIK
jgi:hypothetical protein